VLIRGQVTLIEGDETRQINHSIHMKYVTLDGMSNASVASYLSKGDDVTIKIHLDHLVSWNLADSKAGKGIEY
jgi:hypothetical protein